MTFAGSGPTGSQEIKDHPFFNSINWAMLARKQIPAPFKPKIYHPLDVNNFSDEFTKMEVENIPEAAPPNHERLFRNFSYVAPSLLNKNMAINRLDYPNHTTVGRPRIEEVIYYNKKVSATFESIELGEGL